MNYPKTSWTPEELDKRFSFLNKKLKTRPLPMHNGLTRIASAEEFMLMQETEQPVGGNITIVHFKHSYMRNYLYLLIDNYRQQAEIRIPGEDLPRAERQNFAQAEFDAMPEPDEFTDEFTQELEEYQRTRSVREKTPGYARRLPIVILTLDAGTANERIEKFYADERLHEYRAVTNPHFRIDEEDVDSDMTTIIKEFEAAEESVTIRRK